MDIRASYQRLCLLTRCVAMLTALAAPAAYAVTVHTWVDGEGVRHYADLPPTDGASSSEVQIEDSLPAPSSGANDYYSILNQWNRTRAEKDAATAQELERERIDASTPPLAPAAPMYAEQPRNVSYPGLFPYGYGYPRWSSPPPVTPQPTPPAMPPRNPHSVNTPPPQWPSQR